MNGAKTNSWTAASLSGTRSTADRQTEAIKNDSWGGSDHDSDLGFILEVGDTSRFRSIKQAISYCGLCGAEKAQQTR
jgi:hypothetical protein